MLVIILLTETQLVVTLTLVFQSQYIVLLQIYKHLHSCIEQLVVVLLEVLVIILMELKLDTGTDQHIQLCLIVLFKNI